MSNRKSGKNKRKHSTLRLKLYLFSFNVSYVEKSVAAARSEFVFPRYRTVLSDCFATLPSTNEDHHHNCQ